MTDQELKYFQILQNKKEMAASVILDDFSFRGVRETVTEKYSDQAHFIYELLQNADDAHAKNARFILEPSRLIFAHDGTRHFSVSNPDTEQEDHKAGRLGDINAITGIGNSNKDKAKIGKFGVGFKAVFQYTATPHIYGPEVSFKLEKLFVPKLLENDVPERGEKETLFIFPFDHPDRTSDIAYKDIAAKLRSLIFPLLFLTHLEKIIYVIGETQGEYSKRRKTTRHFGETDAERYTLISKNGEVVQKDELWLFSRVESTGLRYSVGFFLDEEGILKPVSYPAFCFFPTKEPTGLKFLIHAPFLLTDSREGIHAGVDHNDHLIRRLAELSASAFTCLGEMEKEPSAKKRFIEDSVFNIIPTDPESFAAEDDVDRVSFAPFYMSILDVFSSESILPCKSGYVSKNHAYWAANRQFPELFDDEKLGDITGDPQAKWAFPSLARDDLQRAQSPLLPYIDQLVLTFIPEEAIIRGRADYYYGRYGQRYSIVPIKGITPDFIEKQSNSWLEKFYKWLDESNSRRDLAKKYPVFLNQDRKATSAYDGNDKLILFYPSRGVEGYNEVHPDLLNQPDTRKLLDTIGVKQPDLKDQIYNKIFPLYQRGGGINTTEHFKKFFDYYRAIPRDDNREMQEFLEELRPMRFIYCCHQGEKKQYRGMAKEMYFPTPDLQRYFQSKPVWFADIEWYIDRFTLDGDKKETLYSFLRDLGVRDTPVINKQSFTWTEQAANEYRDLLPHPKSTIVHRYQEPVMEGLKEYLEFVAQTKDPEASLCLWRLFIQSAGGVYSLPVLFRGICSFYYYSAKSTTYPATDIFEMRRQPWLLSKTGEFVSPDEIAFSELDERYVQGIGTDDYQTLISLLKFRAEHVEDHEEDTRLTESQRKRIALADQLLDLGATPQDIEFFASYLKNKGENKPSVAEGKEGEEGTAEKEREGHSPVEFTETQDKLIRDIGKKAFHQKHETVPRKLEPETDHDELLPKKIDYSKQIEQEKEKSAIELERLAHLEELHQAAQSSEKYSFAWFKALLELESLSNSQTGLRNREISISFGKVERDQDTERYLVLSQPSRNIPAFMEDLADIPLLLQTSQGQQKVPIEVTSVRGYTLRVKAKSAIDIQKIDFSDVKEARIEAVNPTFLTEELRRAFSALDLEEDFNLQVNLTDKISFIFGPPGTGKTTYLAERIILPMMKEERVRVLILTPTNKAGDVLTRRIMEKCGPEENYKNWLMRYGTTDDEVIEKAGVFRDKTTDIRKFHQTVLITTIARFSYDFLMPGTERLYLRNMGWDYIIIDEASMISLASIIYPLYKQNPKMFFIAGDPKQIEPITSVEQWKNENIYKLVKLNSFENPTTYPHAYRVETLTTQYRSIPAIGEVFSRFAYGGVLKHHRRETDRTPISLGNGATLSTLTLLKYPISKYESIYRSKYLQGSSYQVYSALFLYEYVLYLTRLISENNDDRDIRIGVIAPYRAQADLIAKLISSEKLPDGISVNVGTIHSFQGDECEIVFAVFNTPASITASPEMFLNKQNIINVSISRARDYLFVVMPNDDTPGIENLKLVKRVEELFKESGSCEEISAEQLESRMFGRKRYLEDNSFSTSHQSVNVYGLPEKTYEIRAEDNAVDVQVHRNNDVGETQSQNQERPKPKRPLVKTVSLPVRSVGECYKMPCYKVEVNGKLKGQFPLYVYTGNLNRYGLQEQIALTFSPKEGNENYAIPVTFSRRENCFYILRAHFNSYSSILKRKQMNVK